MIQPAGRELADDIVVGGEAVRLGVVVERDERERRVARARPRLEAVAERVDLRFLEVGVGEPRPRVHRPHVVDVVVELVAGHRLPPVVAVEIGVREVGAPADAAEVDRPVRRGRALHRAVIGQEVAAAVLLVDVLIVGVDGEIRAGVRRIGRRALEHAADAVFALGVAVAALELAGEAVLPDRRQRVALRDDAVRHDLVDVERRERGGVVVDADLDLAEIVVQRPLADIVDDAADIAAAIKRRGGAAEHLNALEQPRVGEEVAEGVVVELHAVAIDAGLRGVEAANVEPVGVRIVAEGLREHARGVAQRLVGLHRAEVVHLLAADHADRLRDELDRRVGLGARGGGDRRVALHGRHARAVPPDRVAAALSLHLDRVELRRLPGLLRDSNSRMCNRRQRHARKQPGPHSPYVDHHGPRRCRNSRATTTPAL